MKITIKDLVIDFRWNNRIEVFTISWCEFFFMITILNIEFTYWIKKSFLMNFKKPKQSSLK